MDIFKGYDLRGVYPNELNEKVFYHLGLVLGGFFKSGSIVLGRDNRLSSSSLSEALIKGLVQAGRKVIDLGLVTTPLLYYGVIKEKAAGGLMITASHNPANYNGVKIVGPKAQPISQKTGLLEIKKLLESSFVVSASSVDSSFFDISVKAGPPVKPEGDKESVLPVRKEKETAREGKENVIPAEAGIHSLKGKVISKKITQAYLNHLFKVIKPKFVSYKIVVDAGNGVAGQVLSVFFKKLKAQVIPLYWELDGRFPHHLPNPLIKENLKDLKRKILQEKADFGLAFDGDGDRIIVLDEKAQVIPGDILGLLIALRILKEKPRGKVLYDVRSSWVVEEMIKKIGGQPIISRVGHSFIKERMRKEGIVFGLEFSGHYYYQANYYFESPLLTILYLIDILNQEKRELSQVWLSLKRYFSSGELNFKISNKEALFEKILQIYHQGKISRLDGLRIEFSDWWFIIRASQTEPLIRLIVEAKTQSLLRQKVAELKKIILDFKDEISKN